MRHTTDPPALLSARPISSDHDLTSTADMFWRSRPNVTKVVEQELPRPEPHHVRLPADRAEVDVCAWGVPQTDRRKGGEAHSVVRDRSQGITTDRAHFCHRHRQRRRP